MLRGFAATAAAALIPECALGADAPKDRVAAALGSHKASQMNLSLIKENGIAVTREIISWRGHRIPMLVLEKTGPHMPHIYVPHGNEPAAFTAALAAIADGGRVISFDSGNSRYLLRDKNKEPFMDANRFFSRDSPYWAVARIVLEKFSEVPYIIALHTNRKGHSFEDDVAESAPHKTLHIADETQIRKIAWLAGFRERLQLAEQAVSALSARGFNCLSESLPIGSTPDGSLSQFCESEDLPYCNIEAPADDEGANTKSVAEDIARMLVPIFETLETPTEARPAEVASAQ